MRALLLLSLATLATGGCCGTRYEVYPDSRGTPEAAFRLFRAALLAGKPELMYESFSAGFRQKYGVGSLREFSAVYEIRKPDFEDMARVVAEASAGEPVVGEYRGVRVARLPVTAYGRRVTFILVEVPTITMDLDLGEDYGRRPFTYHREWREMVEVTEDSGIALKRPVDASEAMIRSPAEIHELRFHRQWFLHDVLDIPVDLRGLLATDGGRPES